jgi:O-antigen ligase
MNSFANSFAASSPAPFAPAAQTYGQSPASSRVRRLSSFFAAYLAIPVLEVPMFGLSLSAPVFCFLALDCLCRPVSWRTYRNWIALASLFWMAHLFSLTANVFSGALAVLGATQALLLVRFAFWMLVFVVTAVLVDRYGLGPRLAQALAAGTFALGVLRLSEAALFGHWGGGNPRFLSQNNYGFGFSAFAPFAIWLVLKGRGCKRLLAAGGSIFLLVAVIGNGSRSSWITVAFGLLLLSALWSLARARSFAAALSHWAGLLLLGAAPVAMLLVAPASLKGPVIERATTLERLDRDKPFLARQLLIEKGMGLFRQNPVFGVGAGGFTQVLTPLEIPRELSYRSLEDFNRKTPHNSYIKVLAETGLIGAAGLFCLLALLTWRGLLATVALARRGDTWAIPVFTGFFTMSIHLWTLSGLTGTAPWFLYGMLAGVIELHGRGAGRARGFPLRT